MEKYDTLVFSGGSLKCLSQIGCIKYFEEKNILKNIRNYVGTSGGTLILLFLVLDYSYEEIRDFFITISNSVILLSINPEQILELFDNYGLNDGSIIKNIVREALYKKLFQEDITFIELAKKTGKNFIICASNIEQVKSSYFCLENTPDVNVVDAIMASCAIPILFNPVEINDVLYVDGGIYNNFPINYDKINKKTSFGINIYSNNINTSTFLGYLKCIINSVIVNNIEKNKISNDNPNVLDLYIDDINWFSINDLKINFRKQHIDDFINTGYNKIKAHFDLLKTGIK